MVSPVQPRVAVLTVGAVMAGGLSASCGGDERAAETTITVFAAASLTDAFAAIESQFESEHPGVDVRLNLAGSSTLREQLLEGAPADVFASASTSVMQEVEDAGLLGVPPVVFATNELAIAVPAGNPGGVTGIDDLGRPELLLGLCAEGVPCGDAAREALAAAGVDVRQDTDEPDVRALLGKIAAGELDAGLVYRTDVSAAAGEVEGIEIPADVNVASEYPIAALGATPAAAARDFVDHVLGAGGQAVLAQYGFGAP